MTTLAQAKQAYSRLEVVGLDYWAAGLDDTMFEISEDIANSFGD